MTTPSPSAPRLAHRRRLWFLLGAIGSVLVVGLVVLLIVWRGGAGLPGDSAAAATRPRPSTMPPPVALAAAPAATPTATPAGPHPTTCGELYSPAMVAAFGLAVLNPPWTAAAESDVRQGTADAELIKVIEASDVAEVSGAAQRAVPAAVSRQTWFGSQRSRARRSPRASPRQG